MNKAYLAGAMEYAQESGMPWRQDVTEILRRRGWDVWNPCLKENDGKPPDWDYWERIKKQEFPRFMREMRGIVKKDLEAMFECQCVIVRVDKAAMKGAGTKGELTMACWEGMEVYAWIDMDREEIPGWVSGCLDPATTVYSFSQLEVMLRKKLEPGEIPAT